MPKLAITSNQNNDNFLSQIHYSLSKGSFGIGDSSTSNPWQRSHEKTLWLTYKITEKRMLDGNSNEYAIFHSGTGPGWELVDAELRNLKIRAKETLFIEISMITTESPTMPLFMQIMTYPEMEVIGGILLLTGLLALTAALIALIPAVATNLALISISSATIAIAGGILFAVGVTLSLATYFCNKKLENDSFMEEYDLTMQQIGFPESKKSFTPDGKKIFFSRFFSMEKADNSSVTIKKITDKETDGDLGLK